MDQYRVLQMIIKHFKNKRKLSFATGAHLVYTNKFLTIRYLLQQLYAVK